LFGLVVQGHCGESRDDVNNAGNGLLFEAASEGKDAQAGFRINGFTESDQHAAVTDRVDARQQSMLVSPAHGMAASKGSRSRSIQVVSTCPAWKSAWASTADRKP